MRILILGLLLLAVLAHSQTVKPTLAIQKIDRSRVVNVPHAPLEFSEANARYYVLENRGKVSIKSFRLGCVSVSEKEFLIVHRMAPIVATLAPGERWFSGGNHGDPNQAKCQKMNAKLAVIEADCGDGTHWRPVRKSKQN
jgi:hypothetical protein